MADIFIIDASPFLDPEIVATHRAAIGPQRLARMKEHSPPLTKAQCAAAGWLLTRCVGDGLTPPPLSHGPRGKPYLADGSDRYISLSHTGRWVCLAVADGDIGLDAQLEGPCRPAVARRCFTQPELDWMQQDPDSRFTRLWVMKEAYLKYTGFGLVLPMHSFTVPLPIGGWDVAHRSYWHCITEQAEGEIVQLSLCGDKDSPSPQLHLLRLSD